MKSADEKIMSRIIFVTLPNGYFGSAGASWKTLDTNILSKEFVRRNFQVYVVPVDEVLAFSFKKDDFVIYTSSDDFSIRSYLKDVMYFINKKATLVPPYEALMSHENKGFQQLFRDANNFGDLPGLYHFDVDKVKDKYPFVFKLVDGAGSKSVHLIKKSADLEFIRRRFFSPALARKLIKLARKIKLSKSEYSIYAYRHKGFLPFVIQKFVPDLSYDYKVLIFGKKYFVLKRSVRDNDFRASGSGNFIYDSVPEEVLIYSENVFNKLKTPYASLDVAFDGQQCFLIEYQMVSFGPYTLINAPGNYQKINGAWVFISGKADLEEEFSGALLDYVTKMLQIGVDC